MSRRLHDAFDITAFRPLAHAWVDQVCDYLQRAQTDPALPVLDQQPPRRLLDDLPRITREPTQQALEIAQKVMDASTHVHHPRYVGHQVATTAPLTALTEMLNAVLNNGMAVYEMGQLQTAMELRVVEWMTSALGLGAEASGMLTSGGSLGNLTALAAARTRAQAGTGTGERLAILVSDQAHYCLSRAGRLLGFEPDAVIAVTSDDRFQLRSAAVERSVAATRARGLRPMALVANACTTATGTFDPIDELADCCEAHELWLHVDGAHGASYCVSPTARDHLRGIERADSIVWDAHKMMLMPALITGVLFRRAEDLAAAFQQDASYLFVSDDDERGFDLGQRTVECTKRAMGVTAYVTLSTLGVDTIVDHLEHGLTLARHLARRVEEAEDFELATPPFANIVCFRHRHPGLDNESLDRHQADLRARLVASGRFFLVQTALRGRLYLRCTFVNPHTTCDDIDTLLESLREVAAGR
ncbi:MAG: aminotransferase class I/II-fold pyridoxal phosphate-dependent enzyme [Myxococcales bacterium FL481]|nr:MAG: aminotransferase class I/II-fold pyridoxal phosphate-dependent enzyme [Myxococcales bacterium FL481]